MRNLLMVLCCAFLWSCHGRETATVIIENAQNGENFNVFVGDRVVIKLDENPTTGYGWTFFSESETPNIIGEISESYEQDKTEENMVGVGGVKTYEFTTLKEGRVKLTGYYYRPWEELHKETDKSVSYTFDISSDNKKSPR